MKICYISNSAAPSKNASSLQTANLCAELAKQGHNVQLILPNTGNNLNYFKYYGIKKHFKILKLKKFKKFPRGIFYYFYSVISILYSNFRYQDIYITRNYFTSLLLILLKKKVILEIHDDLEIEGRIVRFLIKFTNYLNSKYIVNIVTTTKSLKKKFVKDYSVYSYKINVLHNASSLDFNFKTTQKNKNSLNIGYFGSLYLSRGIKLFLDLSKIDTNNKYFLFGGSRPEIIELKKKYKNKNLILTSYLPYSKIKKHINKIDVALLPYTSKVTVSGNVGDISKYTSPLKIFDFMKAGKLILCSNLKVLREILISNHNSILVNDFDKKRVWFNKIKYISSNFKKLDKIRFNAFNYAKKHDQRWRIKKLLSFKSFS